MDDKCYTNFCKPESRMRRRKVCQKASRLHKLMGMYTGPSLRGHHHVAVSSKIRAFKPMDRTEGTPVHWMSGHRVMCPASRNLSLTLLIPSKIFAKDPLSGHDSSRFGSTSISELPREEDLDMLPPDAIKSLLLRKHPAPHRQNTQLDHNPKGCVG